ncbi:MAG: radical SAM family heme chaperone HemW, partial [candidate division Zixibacteria bacterium]|nr:radical SAM family heme chaperone HemW [candidate division Zixibacteria bacterium]
MSFSLYIHFPFCANLCNYCDFYKIPHSPELENRYFKALEIELDLARETIEPADRVLETIYLGGGTPSLADIENFQRLLDQVRNNFQLANSFEFSLEINPESINSDKLLFLKELGLNRPVIGIQSFNPRLLKLLNRKHNLDDSYRVIHLLRAVGFDNFGIDMIFGLPKQTVRLLADDLNQLMELKPPHISYYQLTVEKDTVLDRQINTGELEIPDSDLSAAMYRAINIKLNGYGYSRYEVSSFALAGYECRHNRCYWEGGDFLGLGPSAHSFIGHRRFANSADLNIYLDKLAQKERPLVYDTDDQEARMMETIMLGLRTAKGINQADFRRRFEISIEEALDRASYKIMLESGLIDADGDYIKV